MLMLILHLIFLLKLTIGWLVYIVVGIDNPK